MRSSLHPFWDSLIQPLLKAAGATNIVEIGADAGEHTQKLLEYCRCVGGTLQVIDPLPSFDVQDWNRRYGDIATFLIKKSIAALPTLAPYDTVIIDGDHNWYTVLHELRLIAARAKECGSFPLVLLHDTGWPYGRRDSYSSVEDIPESDRQPNKKAGIAPGHPDVMEEGPAIGTGVIHASKEGGQRNGVRTAIEDFLQETDLDIHCQFLPGFFGFCFLVDRRRLDAEKAFYSLLQAFQLTPPVRAYIDSLESLRLNEVILQESLHASCRQLHVLNEELDSLCKEKEKDCRLLREKIGCISEERERERGLFTFVRVNLEDQIERMQRSKSWTLTAWLRKGEKKMRAYWPKKKQETDPVQALVRQKLVYKSGVQAPPRAVCTIVSKNYLAQARVFARSVREHHPDLPIFVLLVDEPDASMDPANEPFELVPLSALAVSGLRHMCFRYTIKELNTAMKPFFLQYLLQQRSIGCVLYFDPDIIVYSALDRLFSQTEESVALLTPHVLTSVPTGVLPAEIDLLNVGLYNLGFIGVKQSASSNAMLLWWQRHLRTDCIERVRDGLFVDQRWMDFAPVLFDGVTMCRDPECNVAYWNVQERRLEQQGTLIFSNGKPLTFFHFSGFDPLEPDRLTAFRSTQTIASQPLLQELCEDYARRLFTEGYTNTRILPYAFDRFENGVIIPPFVRVQYQSVDLSGRFGDPFSTAESSSLYAWLNTPRVLLEKGRSLTNLHVAIHASRIDLVTGFPLLKSESAEAFAQWLLDPVQAKEYRLDAQFLRSLQPDIPKPLLVRCNRRTVFRACKKISLFLSRKRGSTGPLQAASRPSGVNMVGYFTAEGGVPQAGRLFARAIVAAKIPHVFLDFTAHTVRMKDDSFIEPFSAQNPFNTNLINVNADQIGLIRAQGGEAFFAGRRSIAHWVWEQSTFPDRWPDAARGLSAIWAPSEFSAQGMRARYSLPVSVIPYPVFIETPQKVGRDAFGLSPDTFIFLFIFDMFSVGERKNPLGAVEAFLKAFEGNADVLLVLKFSNGSVEPVMLDRLRSAAARHRNIRLIEGFLPRSATLDLLRCCDCYLSLHRSEGFGLTIAEAMALGKPVIATDYGGSSEFLNTERGFPVPYALRTLEKDFGAYPKGSVWAEPDTGEAAGLMLFVLQHPEEAKVCGKVAAKYMALHYSLTAIGTLMARTMKECGLVP